MRSHPSCERLTEPLPPAIAFSRSRCLGLLGWLVSCLWGAYLLSGCRRVAPVEEIDASSASGLPVLTTPSFPDADSPWWRGLQRDGHAVGAAPTIWNETLNVLWKVPLPGRGHSSPTVVGDRIYLATADESRQVQSVLALDRRTGAMVWDTPLHTGGLTPPDRMHLKSTHANGTVACDGERLYIAFLNSAAVTLSALDLDGGILWQTEICEYDSVYGHAASPCIYESLVIIPAEHRSGGCLAAVHRITGDIVWRKARRQQNYSSAVVARVAGRDQLLISGDDQVTSYDPLTGNLNWTCPGTTETTCGTPVWDTSRVFASGGYPGRMTIAVDASSGAAVWQNEVKCYEQSMLVHDGQLYALSDEGVAYCWDSATGQERWRQRLRGPVSSSLVQAGGLIYATNENGTTYVFRATPERYEPVSENQLGEEGFATPTICDGRIYLRTAAQLASGRQEFLYCLGTAETGE